MDIKQDSFKDTIPARAVFSYGYNFLPHMVFDPLLKYNHESDLWECFPEETTKKNKELLEMILENPSKYLWSEKEKKTLNFDKMQKREEKYKEEGDSLYSKIETACLLATARTEFERNLISYVETRITFEEKLDQIVTIMNMITLMDYEPDDVNPKMKEKVKDLLESG